MHLIHQRPNIICVRHLTSVMSDWLVGGGRGGLLVLSDDHILFLSTAQRGAACYPLPPLPSFPPIILSVPLLLLLSAPSRLLISSLFFILHFFLFFFFPGPDLCVHGSRQSVWKVGNWRIARARMLLLRICCYVLVSFRIMLQRLFLPQGAAVAGVCMDVECVNLLTPSPVSTQGFKQKKVKMLHFTLLFPVRLIFTSHNNERAVSQLDNTLPQSAKRFSDYSICSAQCACTLPSVFFLNKEKRGRERRQSSCAR